VTTDPAAYHAAMAEARAARAFADMPRPGDLAASLTAAAERDRADHPGVSRPPGDPTTGARTHVRICPRCDSGAMSAHELLAHFDTCEPDPEPTEGD
jgi:hypothetical protein